MEYQKLSPGLAAAYDNYTTSGREALTAYTQRLGLVTVNVPARPPRAVVFIRTADGGPNVEALQSAGIEINGIEGGVATGIVPFDAIETLAADPGVSLIKTARPLQLVMDVAPGKVGLPSFVNRTSLSGEGVVVGIVDTGIDAAHPAFRGRIERIWDQTMRGSGVQEGKYGVELTGDRLTESRDTHGHGTHVAGIAAGDDEKFPGVAPKSRIVMVKTDLMDAHITDGIRYCFRIAAELGKPCVVNLSLGGHADSHDGADPMSSIIDAVSGPGKIVCAAAGNDGNDAIHARTVVKAGETKQVGCVSSAPFELNVWYPGDSELEVALAGPSGATTPFQKVIKQGSPAKRYFLPDGMIEISTPGKDPANGDHHIVATVVTLGQTAGNPPTGAAGPSGEEAGSGAWIVPGVGRGPSGERLWLGPGGVQPAQAPITPAASRVWQLRLRAGKGAADSTVDVWALSSALGPAQLTGETVDDKYKVGSPGAATAALTIAAYTTKSSWTDIDGQAQQVGLTVDDISSFSSEGPRRDEKEKPDVAGPGAMIAASLSKDSSMSRRFVLDEQHVLLAGTSMATPFLAGLVALLLQRDPTLTPEAARDALKAAAAIPGQAAGTFDVKWGYGVVNVDKLP